MQQLAGELNVLRARELLNIMDVRVQQAFEE